MNKKPFLIIIYQLFFAIISISIVIAIEGYGTEMFAGAFYFNLLYLTTGGIINYLFYLILQPIFFDKKSMLLTIHFLACLLLMNIFSFFLNSNWITWTLIRGIFTNKDDSFWLALAVHIIMFGCYFLAVLITKATMKMKTISLNKKAT